ncbi:TPA: DUF3265 domain-containing protein [Vibrio parahaemolyticus]|nr:DUF3265 domain-containing protein [Vibrio parahaemolyticus]HCE2594384.1 DUF3265 domain-containing protein [Vibrio parahaemolyticus]HCE3428489.1 DUF3265 domain-containing protein [Vibrio parahaemolyticus]HCG9220589.1 DUF3265 domain-containing protein [Vibrio parahaemolyticus]
MSNKGFGGRVEHATNKLFKRDSQRVAFLLCVGLSDSGGLRRLRYCVAHPLTGRYTNRRNLCTRVLILAWIQKSSGLRKTHILCLR